LQVSLFSSFTSHSLVQPSSPSNIQMAYSRQVVKDGLPPILQQRIRERKAEEEKEHMKANLVEKPRAEAPQGPPPKASLQSVPASAKKKEESNVGPKEKALPVLHDKSEDDEEDKSSNQKTTRSESSDEEAPDVDSPPAHEIGSSELLIRPIKSEALQFFDLCVFYSRFETEENAEEVLFQYCKLERLATRKYFRPFGLEKQEMIVQPESEFKLPPAYDIESETLAFIDRCNDFAANESLYTAKEVLDQLWRIERIVELKFMRPYGFGKPTSTNKDAHTNSLFQCPHEGCPKAFPTKKALAAHSRGHRTVTCTVCQKGLQDHRGNLEKHMKKMHGPKE
jgi:hypothetical protein